MVWLRLLRRIGDYLPPKKAVQVFARFPRNHSVGDIEVQKTVVIEVPKVAGPRPAAHRRSRTRTRIRKTSGAGALKQGVAHGVFAIQLANLFTRRILKIFLLRNTQSRRRPHIRNVKVLPAIIFKIKPAAAHAGAHILDTGFWRGVGKCAVAIGAIQIFAPKIVDHIQIGPLVAVVIAPRTTKAETRVVLIEARLFRNVTKGAVTIVAHHEIGRTILRIVIRHRITILVGALIKRVQAKINIQPAVTVIIRNGGSRERASRRIFKVKCIRLDSKFSSAKIAKQQRAVRTYHDHILAPTVIEIREEGARRIFQNYKSGQLGNVFKGAVAAVPEQTIGKPGRLANIKIVKAIAINVGDRDSVVPINIDTAGAVKYRSPVIRAMKKLRSVGVIRAKCMFGDIDKHGSHRAAPRLLENLPASKRQLLRRRKSPGHLPVADTLLAIEILAYTHQFETHHGFQ